MLTNKFKQRDTNFNDFDFEENIYVSLCWTFYDHICTVFI